MKKYSSFLLLVVMSLFFRTAFAASDSIINIRPEASPEAYAPGTIVLLPDGRRTIIDESVPGGKWKTEEGLIIDRNGVFEDSGQKAIVIDPSGEPYLAKGMQIELPDGRKAIIEEILPDGSLRTDIGVILNPDGTVKEDGSLARKNPASPASAPKAEKKVELEQKKQAENSVPKQKRENQEKKEAVKIVPETQKRADSRPGEKPATEEELTLAQMLPLTRVPGNEARKTVDEKNPEKAEAKAKELPREVPVKERQKAAPEGEKNKSRPQVAEKQEKKPAQEKKSAQERKPAVEKKPVQEKPTPRTQVGQELKIPPEAAKNGNLDFLEGCWQGTRPEYYSKRTIKECFCFGANGSNGKRRVIDPLGKRKCIGATRAHLSSNGVLSVTSDGAYCSDGERWGQAEMVCKNSGPKTPCSWVFRDANNGSQSYQIPFIRVESCGR